MFVGVFVLFLFVSVFVCLGLLFVFFIILVWSFLGCFVPRPGVRSVYKSWLPEMSCELQFVLVTSLYRWISRSLVSHL